MARTADPVRRLLTAWRRCWKAYLYDPRCTSPGAFRDAFNAVQTAARGVKPPERLDLYVRYYPPPDGEKRPGFFRGSWSPFAAEDRSWKIEGDSAEFVVGRMLMLHFRNQGKPGVVTITHLTG